MKTSALAFAAVIALGLASFTAPVSAATPDQSGVTAPNTDISARRFDRKVTIRHNGRCMVRKVVKRNAFGRRVVKKTRICR